MPDTDPDNGSEVADRPSDDAQADRPAVEAKQYLRRAAEQPEDAHRVQARLISADLQRLLTHDDSTVQHNAVEALAALVVSRPDTVVPAAGALQALLAHEDAAIQHNAAGVLAQLAEVHPDAVIPAVEDLQDLRDHDDESVRHIATSALTRLARDHPDAFTDW